MRFLCSVAVMASLMIGAAASPVWAQAWRSSVETDPFTDQPTYLANSTGQSGSINVRCRQGELEVYVVVDRYLGDVVNVRYRFDDGEVVEGTWDAARTGVGAFSTTPGRFARSLMMARSLNLEASGLYAESRRMQISLTGSAPHVGRVLDGCSVPKDGAAVGEGEIASLVIDELDMGDGASVTAVAGLLTELDFYEGPIDSLRRPALYRAFARFYADYWQRCLDDASLTQSCSTWRATRRHLPDVGYPTGPTQLLGEVVLAARGASVS